MAGNLENKTIETIDIIQLGELSNYIKDNLPRGMTYEEALKQLLLIDKNKDKKLDQQEQSQIKGDLKSLKLDFEISKLSGEDQVLYKEYSSKLGETALMKEFALELVKGRKEFIENIIKTERFDRYKTLDKKYIKANDSWQSIASQMLEGGDNSGYEYIPKYAVKLTEYIVTHLEELSQNGKLKYPLDAIMTELDTLKNIIEIEADKKEIEADKKEIEAYNKVLDEYKKVLKNVKK